MAADFRYSRDGDALLVGDFLRVLAVREAGENVLLPRGEVHYSKIISDGAALKAETHAPSGRLPVNTPLALRQGKQR